MCSFDLSFGDQPVHQVKTDKPGPANNQNTFHIIHPGCRYSSSSSSAYCSMLGGVTAADDKPRNKSRSDSRRRIVRASSEADPGANKSPFFPCAMISDRPPMSDAMMGQPAAWADKDTSGMFSCHREGMTRASSSSSTCGSFSLSKVPQKDTFSS